MGLEKETQKYGIDAIKKVFAMGFALGELSHKIRTKSTSWLEKAELFIGCLPEVGDLLTIDLTALKQEYYDLDQDEMRQLREFGKANYSIPEDAFEFKLEAAVFHGIVIAQAIQELAEVWKEHAA